MDTKILEKRLILRESVLHNSLSLSRCAARLQNNQCLIDPQPLIKELLLYNIELNKVTNLTNIYQDEINEYRNP